MGQNSHIEWTDHTFNPWEGCTKVSPGCAHCYAEARNQRFAGGANWGKGAPRRRTSEANWRQPLKWNRDAAGLGKETLECPSCEAPWKECECGFAQRPTRVFCASLADWLDDEVPIEWFVDLLCMIDHTPYLDWLLLTKRPENFEKRMREAADFYPGLDAPWGGEHTGAGVARQWIEKNRPPANVWIGTTVEDQTRADERIPLLLSIPAKVRFLSCEPLLGPVDLDKWMFHPTARTNISGIHWVICGGESGPKARPMHPDFARSLRDQCQAGGVPFFFKQWGEWMPRSQLLQTCNLPAAIELAKRPKMPSAVMRRDGGIDESLGEAHTSNDADSAIYLVGKKAAGALLDGREWKQFPEVTP